MKRLITALAAIVALASQALAEDTSAAPRWSPATCRSMNGPQYSVRNGSPAPCSTGLPIMSTSWRLTARATDSPPARRRSGDQLRGKAKKPKYKMKESPSRRDSVTMYRYGTSARLMFKEIDMISYKWEKNNIQFRFPKHGRTNDLELSYKYTQSMRISYLSVIVGLTGNLIPSSSTLF